MEYEQEEKGTKYQQFLVKQHEQMETVKIPCLIQEA